ncbi:MAG TPA: FAD-dependent oxidoreductase [Acidimicrobiales bacterium]|nr:FAD-dependent oxidoreductase [Acidimicrobiales bacterium]
MGSRRRRRLVVIGGDAAGMSAASQARRLDADLEIVALERGRWTSYSACGIPYLVGGVVGDLDDLVARDPHTFRTEYNIDARTRHEAVAVDVDKQKVKVRDLEHGGRTYTLRYDVLHLATGAIPIRPDLPGIDDDPAVHGVQTMEDAAHLLAHAEKLGPSCRVVVVGGGYIGLEMAEAFTRRGSRTTVITRSPQPLPLLDPDMGSRVAEAIRGLGVELVTGAAVEGFDGGRVSTDAGHEFEADLVVLGLGVAPDSALAGEAGLGLGDDGTILVDRRQQTSRENVYAAGDCCASFHLLTGRRTHVALGTVANKQGRVAGTNIGGGYATFPGVVGTAVTKVCDLECARTGLNEEEAADAGFSFVSATVEGTTRAGYFPGAAPIAVKMLAERGSGRVLGAQIVGGEGSAKRVDVVATAITAGFDVQEASMLDLGYAPPFGPLWDPVLLAARKLAESV